MKRRRKVYPLALIEDVIVGFGVVLKVRTSEFMIYLMFISNTYIYDLIYLLIKKKKKGVIIINDKQDELKLVEIVCDVKSFD